MRPVKYRCWHLPTKTMLPVYGLNFVSAGVVQDVPVEIQIGPELWAPSKDCVLMASLGMLDINKIELFESDLVRRPCPDPACDESHEGEIVWMEDYLDFAIHDH